MTQSSDEMFESAYRGEAPEMGAAKPPWSIACCIGRKGPSGGERLKVRARKKTVS